MISWTIFFLLLSLDLSVLVNAQACAATACSGFIATATACAPSYSASSPLAWTGCICKNGTQFDADVKSCYDCDITFANQTLIAEVANFLGFCARLNGAIANATTITHPPSGTGNTVTILDTVTSSATSVNSASSNPSSASPNLVPQWLVTSLTIPGMLLGIVLFCV